MRTFINRRTFMKTSIVIDDEVMRAAQAARPGATKHALVEEGLPLLAQLGAQQKIRELRGKLSWEGNPIEIAKPKN